MNNISPIKFYFWPVFILIVVLLNLYCTKINLTADTLFPYRYIASLFSNHESLIIVQPGSRIFPEWIYSAIAYTLTKDPVTWSRIVIFINTLVLGFSLLFLFKKLDFSKYTRLSMACVVMLITPLSNLLHFNVLVFFIFSTGIHGFSLPYIIFSFALTINWINKNQFSKVSILLFIVINTLIISSNTSFIIAFSIPLIGLLVFLLAIKKLQINLFLKIFSLVVFSIVLAFVLQKLLKFVPFLLLQDTSISLFDVSFTDWIKDNYFLKKIQTRPVSGYFFELFLMSHLLSIYLVLNKKHQNNKLFLFNALHVIWPYVYVFTLWAMGQYSIRWMPYILLFSPALLIINITLLLNLKNSRIVMSTLLLTILSILLYCFPVNIKTRHQNVEPFLVKLQENETIKGAGLSDYWVSNAINKNVTVLPITTLGYSYLFAMDINRHWGWSNDIKSKLYIDHIINRKIQSSQEWLFNESILINRFGDWQHHYNYSTGKRSFRIYVYPNGISDQYYQKLEKDLIDIKNKFHGF